VVYDPSFNSSLWTVADAKAADIRNPGDIRTWPSDLDNFRDRKGKVISFHGQQDNQITCFNTERFYDHLEEQCSRNDLDDYFRFFRISGMNHCNSGPGAWVFGQGGGASAAGVPFSASKNVLAAIVAWVENGTAPDTIEATKFVNDTVSLGVDFTRKHCRYPLRNTYLGGDSKVASNWACQ
jgi:feruloyl esterase